MSYKTYEDEIIKYMIGILKNAKNGLIPEEALGEFTPEEEREVGLQYSPTEESEVNLQYSPTEDIKLKETKVEVPQLKKHLINIELSNDNYKIVEKVSKQSRLPIDQVVKSMLNYIIGIYRQSFHEDE